MRQFVSTLIVAISVGMVVTTSAILAPMDRTPASQYPPDQMAPGSEKQSEPPTPPFKESPSKKVGLANPASVNCEKKGGKVEIRRGKKGEYGVCKFPNGKECEEWALFRGKCSPDAPKSSKDARQK